MKINYLNAKIRRTGLLMIVLLSIAPIFSSAQQPASMWISYNIGDTAFRGSNFTLPGTFVPNPLEGRVTRFVSDRVKYVLSVKGDRVPFDTAVITEITQYRAETKKLKAAEQLLSGYETEILSLSRVSDICDSLQDADRAIIASKDRVIQGKDQTIKQLNEQFSALLKIQAPRRTWFDRNKLWVGLIAGGAVSAYICSK